MQALIASAFAKGDYRTVKEITYFALKVTYFLHVAFVLVLAHTFQLKECFFFFFFSISPFGIMFHNMSYMFPQTGLFTGISLAIILGVSFGSLATLFTTDSEVLGIIRSGLLVCIYVRLGPCPIFVFCFFFFY